MCETQVRDPKAMQQLSIGLLLLMSSVMWTHFTHAAANHVHPWIEGVQGLVAGIGIGIELMAVIRLSRRRRQSES